MTAEPSDPPRQPSSLTLFWVELIRNARTTFAIPGTPLFLVLWIPLLAWLFFANYSWSPSVSFEDAVLNANAGAWWSVPAFIAFYAIPFLGTLFLYVCCTGKWSCLRNRSYWFRVGFILLLLGLRGGFKWPQHTVTSLAPEAAQFYVDRVAFNSINAIGSFFLIFLFWRVFEKNRSELNGIYGLGRKNTKVAPYVLMLSFMVPLVLMASSRADFLETYPQLGLPHERTEITAAAEVFSSPEWLLLGIFQIAYGCDFVLVELIFRGLMVIGLARYFEKAGVGPGIVWPMVATYGVLHFGKPWGEAVSSLFGGFLLGVIAHSTRNVWGGVFVHIGIALMMEWTALWQHGRVIE